LIADKSVSWTVFEFVDLVSLVVVAGAGDDDEVDVEYVLCTGFPRRPTRIQPSSSSSSPPDHVF
jgi:hypothetical protein